jgi:NAD(P)-dependent dehydrogenase (short-subunit alcohol dehydrogenase family)
MVSISPYVTFKGIAIGVLLGVSNQSDFAFYILDLPLPRCKSSVFQSGGNFMTNNASFSLQDALKDRVVIVTGAGKGIGRAACRHMAQAGAKVLVNNRRHPGESDAQTSAAQLVSLIRAEGGVAEANYDDVSDPQSGERMVQQALHTWGRLDMVYANAAIAQEASFHSLDVSQLLSIVNAGLVSTLSLFHAAWPVFRQQKYGRALASSSSAGRFGNHGLTAYSASKGAIESLVRSLALEGAHHGICCNALSPYALTQMTQSHLPENWAQLLTPESLAPTVAWLLSPECSINGEVIVAGGGRYARAWQVETPAVKGGEITEVWQDLSRLEGQTHRDSVSAFKSFMSE